MEILKAQEQFDNTIIVFLSDVRFHCILKFNVKMLQNGGWPAGGGRNTPLSGTKATSHEGGTRVPAFIYYPPLIQGGQVFNG